MKRTYTILLLVLTFALPASAQQMLIEKSGQENEIVSLNNLKQITFNGTTVNVEQNDGSTSSTSMADISRIYFGDFSSIQDISSNGNLIEYISSDEIAINCTAGTTVTIYSVTGTPILTQRIGTDGGRIGITAIPQGIYIIKANDRTSKFVKR